MSSRFEAVAVLCLLSFALSARAEGGYTNHAGNVIAGWPVALTQTHVTLGRRGGETPPPRKDVVSRGETPPPRGDAVSRGGTPPLRKDVASRGGAVSAALRGETYPLSIFPESEQRRIAADFGEPRLPVEVRRAIAGAEKAMARSRKRAEKGFCTKEESEAFCAKSESALKAYLDRQVETGRITAKEREKARRK